MRRAFHMFAEIVLDLPGMGDELGRVLDRDLRVLPSLNKIADMWAELGVEVTAFHVIAPGAPSSDTADEALAKQTFSELHMRAWWEAEQLFVEDRNFTVDLRYCAANDAGPVALDALIVTTALSRSDELAKIAGHSAVIVVSNRESVGSAVTHARGVTVMVAGTVIPDPSLAHVRLDPSWLSAWSNRMSQTVLDRVELRNGRPWKDGAAIGTPYDGTEGRNTALAVMPSFAKSVALFEPTAFSVAGEEAAHAPTPQAPGIATVVQRLGFGELVHVEVLGDSPTADAQATATLYRFATDHPDASIIVASTRPSLIAATTDLDTYSITNKRRVLRLCLPERDVTFDEEAFAGESTACRIVIESTLSEPLFAAGENLNDTAASVGSPVLTLWTNPNTAKRDVADWRSSTQRHFVMIGADGTTASPADSAAGPSLPVTLGGCTDFEVRAPALRPGCVAEAVMNDNGDRWVIVSDPIERRRKPRVDGTTLDGDLERAA